MGDVGLLPPDARVELIDGEIIDMSPIGRLHKAIVNRIDAVLKQALAGHAVAIVQVQASVKLSDLSEPEPDLAVLAWRDDYYIDRDAGVGDIKLLIEVGESSVRYDRHVKLPLYARHGVAEVWLVELTTWKIHVMTRPGPQRYADEQSLGPGDTITIFDVGLQVSELLGPKPDSSDMATSRT